MPLSRRYCYRHGCPGSGESPATVAYRPPSLWWGPVRVYGRRRWLSSSRQDTGAAGRSTTQLPARPDDINSGSPGEGRRHPISHLGPRQGIRETSLRVPQSDLQQSHGPRAPVGWVRLGGDSRVRYESGTGGYTARNRGRVARIERCWLAPRSTRTRNDPALEAEPQLPDLPRRKGRAYCLKRKEGKGKVDGGEREGSVGIRQTLRRKGTVRPSPPETVRPPSPTPSPPPPAPTPPRPADR